MAFICSGLVLGTIQIGFFTSFVYLISYMLTLAGFFCFYLLYTKKQSGAFIFLHHFQKIQNKTLTNITLNLFGLIILLFSMGGIPPFIGFLIKYYTFLIFSHYNFIWLIILALLTSCISLFIYLRIIKIILLANNTK